MKKNLAFVCFDIEYCKKIGKKFADFLDMLFVDIREMLEYNMINDAMKQNVGEEYYNKKEQATIKEISGYDNALVTVDGSIFIRGNNHKLLAENCTVVYLKITQKMFEKSNKVSSISTRPTFAFDVENKLCKQLSDLTIDILEKEQDFEIIKNSLSKFLCV